MVVEEGMRYSDGICQAMNAVRRTYDVRVVGKPVKICGHKCRRLSLGCQLLVV